MKIIVKDKEKSYEYLLLKKMTDYDSRWVNGNIVSYTKTKFQRAKKSDYDRRKSIIKKSDVFFIEDPLKDFDDKNLEYEMELVNELDKEIIEA